jgi:anti-sigma factor RsiW
MNLNNDCHDLDAYLSDDMPGDKRAIFESHFEGCPACRDEVDQQRWIDDLLHSPARIQLDTPSVTILDSFRVSVAQRRRRILQAACGLAAAATLLIAFGLLELHRQAIGTWKSEEHSVAVSEATHAPAPVQPAATFVSTSDTIVVPLESPSADVTIVQVYPTTDTERRWRLEAALFTNL